MLLTFECPGCGKSYERPLSLAGKKARRKQCGLEFLIPAPSEARSDRPSDSIRATPAPTTYAVEKPRPRPAGSPGRETRPEDVPPRAPATTCRFLKGDDITVIGNPGVGGRMVLENAVSRGVVSSMTSPTGHSLMQLGISINPGNSAGPVFDSMGRRSAW